MPGTGFHDVGLLKRASIALFGTWGYQFYRAENQLRADAQLIRTKVGWILGNARKHVETAEHAYRREFLPPPSRAKPRHDASAVTGAQVIERLSRALGALQGKITAQPVSETDHLVQRHWKEAEVLQKLLEWDEILVGQAELLRSMLEEKTGSWLIENAAEIQEGLNAITETLRNRQAVLHG